MQIVILAAGKGTRMGELTKNTPKPLLTYKGQTLLENKFNNLPEDTTEIILVINYLGHKIKEKFGSSFNNIPIKYIEQPNMNGTADALWQCRDVLSGPFMVLMADDLYSKTDLDKLAKTNPNDWAVLVYPDKPGTKAGKMITDSQGRLIEIYNDLDGTTKHNLLYTGACVLTPEVFTKEMVKTIGGEYGLPQTFVQFAKEKNIWVLETKNWIRITKPEDLIK